MAAAHSGLDSHGARAATHVTLPQGMTKAGIERKATCRALFSKLLYLAESEELAPSLDGPKRRPLVQVSLMSSARRAIPDPLSVILGDNPKATLGSKNSYISNRSRTQVRRPPTHALVDVDITSRSKVMAIAAGTVKQRLEAAKMVAHQHVLKISEKISRLDIQDVFGATDADCEQLRIVSLYDVDLDAMDALATGADAAGASDQPGSPTAGDE